LQSAYQAGVTLPLTQRVRELFADLASPGAEMLDHSALILQLERLAAESKQASQGAAATGARIPSTRAV
jgi:hypothetical protein